MTAGASIAPPARRFFPELAASPKAPWMNWRLCILPLPRGNRTRSGLRIGPWAHRRATAIGLPGACRSRGFVAWNPPRVFGAHCWKGSRASGRLSGCRARLVQPPRGIVAMTMKRHAASRHWRMLWRTTTSRTSSIPIRAASSRARPSPACSSARPLRSAWTAKRLGGTTSWSSGGGAASNMRRCIRGPATGMQLDRPRPRRLQSPQPTFAPRRHATRSSLRHPAALARGSLTLAAGRLATIFRGPHRHVLYFDLRKHGKCVGCPSLVSPSRYRVFSWYQDVTDRSSKRPIEAAGMAIRP